MKVVSFIEPPQGEVIEKILKHCGLWQEPACRPPPDTDGLSREPDFGFLSCFYAAVAARFAPGKPLFSPLNCYPHR